MNSKYKNDYVDDFIEKAVKEEFALINVDNEKKEQQWNELMSALDEMNKQKKPRKLHKVFVTISASILLLFSITLFEINSGSAFGWLKKIFIEEDGLVTRVNIGPDEQSELELDTKTTNFNISTSKEITFSTIEDAIQHVDQKIFVPSYLPESTKLVGVNVFYKLDHTVGIIEQIYSFGEENIIIRQRTPNFSPSYHFDNEDSLITNLDLSASRNIILISHKDDKLKFFWTQDHFTFSIEAGLNQDEMIKISESLK